MTQSGKEEPLSTHADHYTTNYAYGRAAYTKGAVAIAQMNYLVGEKTTLAAQKKFYNQWKFKHPTPNDWIRAFERESGLELDWYLDYWVNSTHTIDYGISEVRSDNGKTLVSLRRIDEMPMPMEITVTLKDGSRKLYYIPLTLMRGEKTESSDLDRVILNDWPWTNRFYDFTLEIPMEEIGKIEIDESGYLADVNRNNNVWGY